jgi:hypothetical protein
VSSEPEQCDIASLDALRYPGSAQATDAGRRGNEAGVRAGGSEVTLEWTFLPVGIGLLHVGGPGRESVHETGPINEVRAEKLRHRDDLQIACTRSVADQSVRTSSAIRSNGRAGR